MAYRTATFDGVAAFESRGAVRGTGRRVLRSLVGHALMAVGAVATVAVVGATAIFAAGWFLGSAVVTNPYIHANAPSGPGRLAWVDPATTGAGRGGFETAWARTQKPQQDAYARPLIVEVPESAPKAAIAAAPVPVPAARPAPAKAAAIPLPHARPVIAQETARQETARQEQPRQELARAPVETPAAKPADKAAEKPQEKPVAEKPAQVAAIAPPPHPAPDKRVTPQVAPEKDLSLSDSTARTAVYDITAGTVFMPDGRKLEAHSGLYEKMDDPRFIKVRMRGPTPPNVYVLTEREQLFHGVRAIRLNPVDRDRMFGRDGMLAHTYMLGPNGQSNGCVSFKNYDRFLEAFLDGKVDKLVVVASLGNQHWRTAAAQAEGVNVPARRFASSASRGRRYAAVFGAEEPASTQALGYASSDRAVSGW